MCSGSDAPRPHLEDGGPEEEGDVADDNECQGGDVDVEHGVAIATDKLDSNPHLTVLCRVVHFQVHLPDTVLHQQLLPQVLHVGVCRHQVSYNNIFYNNILSNIPC